MIKEKEKIFRKLLMILDIFIVIVSFYAAFKFRQNIQILYRLDLFPGQQVFDRVAPLSSYLNILPVVLFVWWAALSSSGLYESFRKKHFFEIVWEIVKSSFFVTVIFASIAFIFKFRFVSRSLMLTSFLITALLLIIERWVIVSFLRSLRKKGYNYKNVLLVGTGCRAKKFIKLIDKHNEWGLKVIGLIDADKNMLGRTICGKRVIGTLDDIPELLSEKVIDEVVFIVPRKWLSMIEKSLLACEIRGIKASLATDFFNTKIAHWTSGDIEGIPLLGFKTTIGEEWQLLLKRLFDIMLSVVGIIAAFPIFAALAIAIKWFYGNPVIFKQSRSGLNGRQFIMYKFRTMVNGAEKKKDALHSFNEMDGPVFKMRNDPRVTGFGKFLRRSSLDELPQLFNVLKGDMSIVGPRPPIPAEVSKYEVWQRRRLSMKPGLTCFWQANGRNSVDFEKWMRMDLEYIDNWSLGLDFKILLKTVPAVLFSAGVK